MGGRGVWAIPSCLALFSCRSLRRADFVAKKRDRRKMVGINRMVEGMGKPGQCVHVCRGNTDEALEALALRARVNNGANHAAKNVRMVLPMAAPIFAPIFAKWYANFCADFCANFTPIFFG